MQFLPSALLDNKTEIKDISLIDDSNFIRYEPKHFTEDDLIIPPWFYDENYEPPISKWLFNEKDPTYYYADCESDVVTYEFHKAYCISYRKR